PANIEYRVRTVHFGSPQTAVINLSRPYNVCTAKTGGRQMRRCTFALTSVLLLVQLSTAADIAAPARTVDIVDHSFGLTLPDPYRWMEGENNSEFTTWLAAQGARTRAELDASPIRARWTERLKVAGNSGRVHRLQRPTAGRVFFVREDNGQEGVLMVRDA